MVREEFRLGEVIVKAGVYQKWMYSICQGAVDIYSNYGTTNEKKLVTLTEGQFFGEIGMIAVMPRTATAVAASENVVLEQICNEDFEDYLKNHPENLQAIMSSVSKRIRELTEDLSTITQMTNKALAERESGNNTFGWLVDSFHNLVGKLKAKKDDSNTFAVMVKRQRVLAGELPPVVRYAAGTVIFRAGDAADCMYDICDGSVGIYSDYQTENEKLLTTLCVDNVFGEMGVLDDMPRSATAVCLTDCAVIIVKPESFMNFFQTKPIKILQILQQMCMQLRDLSNTYLQVLKSLEELTSLKETDSQEDDAYAKLEYIRQSHLCVNMYDYYGCADRLYYM